MDPLITKLAGLDPGNDDHWTDGLPNLKVVEQLTGWEATREQLTALVPDYTRENMILGNVPGGGASENGDDPDAGTDAGNSRA